MCQVGITIQADLVVRDEVEITTIVLVSEISFRGRDSTDSKPTNTDKVKVLAFHFIYANISRRFYMQRFL